MKLTEVHNQIVLLIAIKIRQWMYLRRRVPPGAVLSSGEGCAPPQIASSVTNCRLFSRGRSTNTGRGTSATVTMEQCEVILWRRTQLATLLPEAVTLGVANYRAVVSWRPLSLYSTSLYLHLDLISFQPPSHKAYTLFTLQLVLQYIA